MNAINPPSPRAAVLCLLLLASVLSQTASAVLPPTITNVTVLNGFVQMSVASDIGVTNQILTATNLSQSNWTVLSNIVVKQSPYTFVDGAHPAGSARFYRIAARSSVTGAAPVNMSLIPAGTFEMGDTFYEGAQYELPLHQVYCSAFYMDKYEVTYALWNRVRGWSLTNGYSYDNAGEGKATNHPVYNVSWYDVVKWCNARSQMEGRPPAYFTDAGLTQVYTNGQVAPYVNWNAGYRLPTESEWEKADRGGASGHRFPWTNSDTISYSQANYYSDTNAAPSTAAYDRSPPSGYNPKFATGAMPYTSPVGSFAPNGYGLYDTAGNVWEWCWDYAGTYPSVDQTDPRGPETGSTRVGRGGNWNYYPIDCRDAYRYGNDPNDTATNIGFRTALPSP